MSKIRRDSIVLGLLIIFALFSNAQTKLFTNGELPSEMIYQITQDKEGYMWFATDRGIVKYDGTKIRTFTMNDGLPSNDIWMLNVTENNKIWYYSKNSIQGYIYKDSVYSFEHENKDVMFVTEHYIKTEDEMLYWDFPNFNLCKIVDNKWKVIHKSTTNLQNGNFNFPIYKYGIKNMYKSNNSITLLDDKNKSHTLNTPNTFGTHIVAIHTNKIISLKYHTTSKVDTSRNYHFFDTETKQFHELNFGKYKKIDLYHFKIIYKEGKYQLFGDNFHCELDSNYTVINLTKINPKLKKHANFKDNNGNLWLGSLETGIHFIPKKKNQLQLFHTNKSVRNFVEYDNQLLYILDNENIAKHEKEKTSFLRKNNDSYIYTISSLDKHLTYHTGYSGYKYTENNSFEKLSPFFQSKKNVAIGKDIYSLSAAGIVRITQSQFLDQNLKWEDLIEIDNQQSINDITKHDDTLFVATNNGLYILQGNKISKHSSQFNYPINFIETSNNQLLLGTREYGLATYKKGEIKFLKESYTAESLRVFGDSLILISSKKGLYCYKNKKNSIDLVYRFTQNDGLPSDQTLDATIYKDSLYIGTNKGLVVMPFNTKKDKVINPLQIESFFWNGSQSKETDIESYYNVVNSVEVNFKSIQYNVNNYDKYSYRLLPSQKDFQEVPTGNVNIRNLPIGKNILELKIIGTHGDETVKQISINIKPKLYQQIWFYPLLVFLAMVILFFYFRHQRIKRNNKAIYKVKKQEELANFKLESLRSQMNPHFVFNSLNAILYYINENETKLSEKYLVKFSRLIRQYFELSTEKEISLEKEIELLKNYLTLEEMRFDPLLIHTIKLDENLNLKSTFLPTMLIQPIVENAINHGIFHKGEKGEVVIEIKYINEKSFKISISDDGIGIEKGLELKKNMLKGHNSKSTFIFKQRISLLNESKDWKIEHEATKLSSNLEFPGTKVTLLITKL